MADKPIAIKWIEAILLIVILLVGLGLCSLATAYIEFRRELGRPREEAFIRNAELPLRQSELTTAQAELTTLNSKITEQEIDRVKLSAKLESLKATYKWLNTADPADDDGLRPDVKTAFATAQVDFDSSGRALADLKNRLSGVKSDAQNKATKLNEVQESMHKDFERAQKNYQFWTRAISFGVSLGLSIIVIAIVGGIAVYLNRREQLGIRTTMIWLVGLASLLVLTSYQALSVAGATLAVIAVIVIATIVAVRGGKEAGAT